MSRGPWLAVLLAACGGAQTPGAQPAAAEAQSAERQDQVFSYPEQTSTGTIYNPEALAQPEVTWTLPGKRTVVEQRRIFARARGAARFDEGDALAALLWTQNATAESRAEARKILEDLAKDPAVTEEVAGKAAMLEIGLGDDQAASALFEQLAAKAGKTDAGARWLAYRAFVHLRHGENDKARALVGDLDSTGKPEVAYAQAWIRFRGGDLEGARQKIFEAAGKWPESASLARVLRELMLIAARAGADSGPTADALARGGSKTDPAIIKLLGGLADAYLSAGEYDQRMGVLRLLAAATPTPDVLAFVYFYQSDVEYRMNRPVEAAKRLIDAWAQISAPGVGGVAEKTRNEIAQRSFELAAIYHRIYAASFDPRFGDAAKSLFTAYLAISPPAPFAADAKQRLQSLTESMGRDHTGAGVFDKDEISRSILARREQLTACYERLLQGDPQLAGKASLSFDIGEDGTVPTVTTDPAGGGTGLAGVMGCAASRVKTWSFPKRGKPGLTRVVAPLVFTRAK